MCFLLLFLFVLFGDNIEGQNVAILYNGLLTNFTDWSEVDGNAISGSFSGCPMSSNCIRMRGPSNMQIYTTNAISTADYTNITVDVSLHVSRSNVSAMADHICAFEYSMDDTIMNWTAITDAQFSNGTHIHRLFTLPADASDNFDGIRIQCALRNAINADDYCSLNGLTIIGTDLYPNQTFEPSLEPTVMPTQLNTPTKTTTTKSKNANDDVSFSNLNVVSMQITQPLLFYGIIAVIAVIVCVIIALIIFCCLRRKRKQRKEETKINEKSANAKQRTNIMHSDSDNSANDTKNARKKTQNQSQTRSQTESAMKSKLPQSQQNATQKQRDHNNHDHNNNSPKIYASDETSAEEATELTNMNMNKNMNTSMHKNAGREPQPQPQPRPTQTQSHSHSPQQLQQQISYDAMPNSLPNARPFQGGGGGGGGAQHTLVPSQSMPTHPHSFLMMSSSQSSSPQMPLQQQQSLPARNASVGGGSASAFSQSHHQSSGSLNHGQLQEMMHFNQVHSYMMTEQLKELKKLEVIQQKLAVDALISPKTPMNESEHRGGGSYRPVLVLSSANTAATTPLTPNMFNALTIPIPDLDNENDNGTENANNHNTSALVMGPQSEM